MTPVEAALATATIKGVSGPMSKVASSWGSRKWDKFRSTYTNVFSEYIESSIAKCRSVRNVLYRNQQALTIEKYVSISFISEKEDEVSDESIVAALTTRRAICLKGRGGAGKTMFTKWTVLTLLDRIENHQLTPIYIELRDLQDLQGLPFEELVFRFVSNNRSKVNFSLFLEGLKAGLFVFILDAADEIRKNQRISICKKIEHFRQLFPETGILLTTREFPEINSISGFEFFATRSLKKGEAIEIVKKLDYDDEVKDALVKTINSEKSGKHDFFLENPLLTTILLLTYDQSKDIPTKRSAIYKRAFEALFERHDGSKGIFKRDHHAGLPLDEFETVFSTFCFGTYLNGIFDIPEGDLVKLFREACRLSGINEDPQKIALDAFESVCLLVKEGHDYVFCHRSFQEYFVAVYLRDYRGDDAGDLYKAALSRGPGENVAEFIYEIDRKSLELSYVIPGLKRVISSSERKMEGANDKYRIFLHHFYKDFRTIEGDFRFAGFTPNNEVDLGFLMSISDIYPDVFPPAAIIDFNKERPVCHQFPIEKAIASRSHSLIDLDRNSSRRISQFKLTASANDWFAGSDMERASEAYFRALKALLGALEETYSKETKAGAISRFSGFGRTSDN